ncbi:MAG TPA: RNA-protein complex protein Nop10 [Conexivisphaerales archaeon]|nr:RNA-protein complex protein Nop10 [Conexivisphaerales archaeon]
MKGMMRRCEKCDSYTFKEICPKCGGRTVLAQPPKFSPQDKYLRLRMQGSAKQEAEES